MFSENRINMMQGDCMEYMASLPDNAYELAIDTVSTGKYNRPMESRKSNELQVGKAGEYFVCAELCMMGLIAFPSEQGLPYDVLIDTGDRLLKCQVKTTSAPRAVPQRKKETKAYIFNVKRKGKGNLKRYADHEVDVFALVCLDTKQVGFIQNQEMPETINIRADRLKGSYYDEKGIKDYKKVADLYKTIKNKSEIARILGLHQSVVSKMLQDDYTPFRTGARYFSDFIRGKEWFLCLK